MLLARILTPKTFSRHLIRCFASKIDQFKDRDLKLEDTEAVTDFYHKYFIPVDPISEALGITPEMTKDMGQLMVPYFLNNPVSFLTYSQDDQLVAVKLNSIIDFNHEIIVPEFDIEKMELPVLQALAVASHFEDELPNLVPNVKRWMYLYMGCVRPDFYRRGLATKMWSKSLELAKEQKCEGAFAVAITAGSQNGLAKLGFECVKEAKYKDYVDPVTEQNVFLDVKEPESIRMLVKTW